MWGILHNTNFFTVRQHVKVLPKACCTCPPCAPQENSYSVYTGLTQENEAEFLRVDEVSDDWNRCCCRPNHPLKLEVRQYLPVPGDNAGSDFSHIAADVRGSWDTLTKSQRYLAVRDMYRNYPPLMTFIRQDGQRCCRLPMRCLTTFVCFGCCIDGVDVYAGALQDNPDSDKGRPFNLESARDRLIGRVIQPTFGGFCHPQLNLHSVEKGVDQPFAIFDGPCCFGGDLPSSICETTSVKHSFYNHVLIGWSECCCDFRFALSRPGEAQGLGSLGVITKKKPASLAGAMRELISDADVYSMAFPEGSGLTAGEKSTALATLLLTDYILFEGNTKKCDQDDECIYCYCWYCMVFGALVPCKICIPKKVN